MEEKKLVFIYKTTLDSGEKLFFILGGKLILDISLQTLETFVYSIFIEHLKKLGIWTI